MPKKRPIVQIVESLAAGSFTPPNLPDETTQDDMPAAAPGPLPPLQRHPLALRAAHAAAFLSLRLHNLSREHAEIVAFLSMTDLAEHPCAERLFVALSQAEGHFSAWYRMVGSALAELAPGREHGS